MRGRERGPEVGGTVRNTQTTLEVVASLYHSSQILIEGYLKNYTSNKWRSMLIRLNDIFLLPRYQTIIFKGP